MLLKVLGKEFSVQVVLALIELDEFTEDWLWINREIKLQAECAHDRNSSSVFPEDIVIVNEVAYVSGLGDGTIRTFNLNLGFGPILRRLQLRLVELQPLPANQLI